MLVAVLNCCTKEELEESSSDEDEATVAVVPTSPSSDDVSERRKVIKNKILAVGRVSRVFALLRFVLFILIISACD